MLKYGIIKPCYKNQKLEFPKNINERRTYLLINMYKHNWCGIQSVMAIFLRFMISKVNVSFGKIYSILLSTLNSNDKEYYL